MGLAKRVSKAPRSSHSSPRASATGCVIHAYMMMPGTSPPLKPYCRARPSSWILFSGGSSGVGALTWNSGRTAPAARRSKLMAVSSLGGLGVVPPHLQGMGRGEVGHGEDQRPPMPSSPLKWRGEATQPSRGRWRGQYTAEASLMYSHARARHLSPAPEARHDPRSHHRLGDPASPRIHRAGDERGNDVTLLLHEPTHDAAVPP